MADARPAKELLPVLASVTRCIEELMLGGLTVASRATCQTLELAFKEAARVRLLRLAVCLRSAAEELARYERGDEAFSRHRLHAHLVRAWLLSTAIERAVGDEHAGALDTLLGSPSEMPFDRLEVVGIGVIPRIVAGAYVAFELRLRALEAADGGILPGTPLTWSCVIPHKTAGDVPPEAFLALPQRQGFSPAIFLERRRVVLERCAVIVEPSGARRISLGGQSKVTPGAPVASWPLQPWDPAPFLERLASYRPLPTDLDVELREEVLLDGASLDAPRECADEGSWSWELPLRWRGVEMVAVVPRGLPGNVLRTALERLRDADARVALFGLLHCERCRLVVEPVSALAGDGPHFLTVDSANIDPKLLLKAFSFVPGE